MLDDSDLNILKDLSRRHHDILLRCASSLFPGSSGLDCASIISSMMEEADDGSSLVRIDINRNNTVCHAQADSSPFCEGDIITLDMVLEQSGLYADGAWSFICGDDVHGQQDLLEMAWACARQAVLSVSPGHSSLQMKKDLHELLRLSDMYLLGDACGHGIGRSLHMLPDINYEIQNSDDVKWEKGMVFTSEPVVTRGKTSMIQDGRGDWVTENGKASAYYEHMCLIEGSEARCLNIPEINNINCIDIF